MTGSIRQANLQILCHSLHLAPKLHVPHADLQPSIIRAASYGVPNPNMRGEVVPTCEQCPGKTGVLV